MSAGTKRVVRGKSRSALAPAACVIALCFAGFVTGRRPCMAQAPAQAAPQPTTRAPRGTQAVSTAPTAAPLTYDQLIQQAKALVSSGPEDGLQLSRRAIQQDPSRYEAHVIAAGALGQQKQYGQATVHLQVAMALAPDDQKPSVARALAEMKVASLPADSRRKLDGLMLILDDAQQAKSATDRERLLHEFLDKSDAFLNQYPSIADVWLIRATVALELDEAKVGWQAGRMLVQLAQGQSPDPKTRRLMARLERNGWLDAKPPVIPGLIASFNAKLQSIGEQRCHVTKSNQSEEDSTYSLEELKGDWRTGLETIWHNTWTWSIRTSYHLSDRTVNGLSQSVNVAQPSTLRIGEDGFNARVLQNDASSPRQCAWRLVVGPVYAHDGKVRTISSLIDLNDTMEATKDATLPSADVLSSNSKDDLQFLADTLMKIHAACLDSR